MLTGILDFDRLEGPRPDVKNDLGAPNAAPNEGLQKLRSEMKTGGGRRDRSRFASVDGLIPLRVHSRVGAPDVWRKRDVPVTLDQLVERPLADEPHDARSSLRHFENLDGEPRRVLYRVRFIQKDVWPAYDSPSEDLIEMEIYEHWLEPA